MDLTYASWSRPKHRLTWPESVRSRLEADYAAATPHPHRWLTVRYVFRRSSAEVYSDGRLLCEARHPELETAGHVGLNLYRGVKLETVTLRELTAEDIQFGPVPLNGTSLSGRSRARR